MNINALGYGTYLLLLECEQTIELPVGRLGQLKTEPGYYLYVGSAFGPGGIQARLKHHMQVATRPHWHIDYLRTVAKLIDAWCAYDVRLEHDWAQALLQSGAALVPLKGFGSSDCGCITHLFYFKHRPVKGLLQDLLESKLLVASNAGKE